MARTSARRGRKWKGSLEKYIRGVLPCLGIVLCLLLSPWGKGWAAPPSRVLQLRDAGGKLAVGLGEAAGTLRVSSKDGLRITTAKGGVEEAFPRALRIIGAAAGDRPSIDVSGVTN